MKKTWLLSLLLLVALGCIGQSQMDVTWTNTVGATASGTSLTKTASNGWGNAGAESLNVLPTANDGYIAYTVTTLTAGEFTYGFSDLNVDNNFYTVEYAFHRTNSGLTYVRLSGTMVVSFFVAVNDQLTMERSGTNMIFKKNSTTLYTANNVQINSLIVDAALYSNGSSITNLKVGFAPAPVDLITWGSLVGVTQTNSQTLTKTASSGYGNAGASSMNVLGYEQDGWIEFTLDSWNNNRAFGFSDINSNNSENTIDFAFVISGTNIYVYENGVSHGNIPSAALGDRFRITRLGDAIYWQRNGFTFYFIAQTYRGGMIADVALGTSGATVYNAKCSFIAPSVNPGVVPPTPEFTALTDLYNQVNGPNWRRDLYPLLNWPPTEYWPITQSHISGAHDNDGFLHYVALADMNLSGVIPQSFWKTRHYRGIYMSGNHIKAFEDFGADIALGKEVYELDFASNEIESIPTGFGFLSGILDLRLDHNRIKSLPEFVGVGGPYYSPRLSLYDNELTTLPESILSNSNIKIRVDSNYLDFSVLEQVYDQVIDDGYPLRQKKIRDVHEITAVEGHPLIIPSRPPGNYSTIFWDKLVSGTWTNILSLNEDSSDETFTRNTPVVSDTGIYRWRMTNSVVTGVTLESEPIEVTFQTKLTWAIQNMGFMYRYDGRKRMIGKKVPGADWIHMVYDNRDRLVMTQDGQQRLANQWTYTRYDELNRPVITGIYTHSATISQEAMTSLIGTTVLNEDFAVEQEDHFGYSRNAFPSLVQNNFSVLTAIYYDDYGFIGLFDPESLEYRSEEVDGQYEYSVNATGHFPFVKGQVTGSVTAVLQQGLYELPDTGRFIHAVTYYDDRYRPVQSISLNIHNTYDVSTSVYDFTGKVMAAKTRQNGLDEHAVVRTFQYDHAGRLKKVWHKLDTGNAVLIAMNTYNELGQLTEKGLHNTATMGAADNTRMFRQKVDYSYNIRGWLTAMNNSELSAPDDYAFLPDLFGMNLFYNLGADIGNSPAYNGNISGMKWSSFSDGSTQSAYKFEYDDMNRLLSANGKLFTEGWADTPGFAEHEFEYDLNGNIKHLARTARNGDDMDVLSYNYGEEGLTTNQLRSVTDESSSPQGFKDGNQDGADYEYDKNGNMIVDRNKGISSITYNHLNLPEIVATTKGDYIRYVYDATGRKWQQVVAHSSGGPDADDDHLLKVTDYMGEFIYENGKVRFANHEEGRIVLGGTEEIFSKSWEESASFETLNATTYTLSDNGGGIAVTPSAGAIGYESGLTRIGYVLPVEEGEWYTVKFRGINNGSAFSLRTKIGNNVTYIPVELDAYGSVSSDMLTWHEYSVRAEQAGDMTIGLVRQDTESDDWLYLYEFVIEINTLVDPEYQYHLKDHLGNVRVTFTSKERVDESTATMEEPNAGEEYGKFIDYDNMRLINHVVYDHTYDDQTPPDGTAYAIRLNGSEHETMGLAKSLSVMPGDTLKIEVFAKYYEPPPGGSMGIFATLMANIIAGTPPSGTFENGAGYAVNSPRVAYLL